MRRHLRLLLGILLLAALYFGAAMLGVGAAIGDRPPLVPAVWPAAGVALAALLIFGTRLFPGIALGAFLMSLGLTGTPLGAAIVAAGATAGALAGVSLLTNARFRPSLARVRDVLAFVAIGAVAHAAINASTRTAALWARGMIPWEDVGWNFLKWWAGDATGVLIVGSASLVWLTAPDARFSRAQWIEAGLMALAAVTMAHLVFRTPADYTYALFPIVGWAALRLGTRGAAALGALLAAQAILYTLRGHGPFADSLPRGDLFELQLFLAVLAVTCLILAAALAEWRASTEALEARVRQQAALVAFGERALALDDMDALLHEAVSAVNRTLGTGFCKVLELMPDGHRLMLRAGIGWHEGQVGHYTVSAGSRSQAGYTLKAREPVIVDDFAAEQRFERPALLAEHGIVSGASVPLGDSERPFGVLACHSRERADLTAEDARFLLAVAHVTSTAIQRLGAERALRASRARIRHLAELSTTVFYATQLEGERFVPTWISANLTRVTGFSIDEALQPTWWIDHLHPGDRARVVAEIPPLLEEGRRALEYRFRFKDDSYHWMHDEATVRRDTGGAPEIVGSWIDVTARKRTELLLASLLGATPDGIVVSREDGTIVLVNEPAEQLFGYARHELIGRSIDDLVPERVHATHGEQRAGYFRDPQPRTMGLGLDLLARRKDGSEFPVEISLSPMQSDDDGLLVIAAVRDVSQRKVLEDRLRQSQRLESVGRLAAGIAHDFNNLLTTIIGYGDLLEEELDASSPHRASLAEMTKAADRAATLTHQLLAFSRKQILQPKVLDPNAVVEDMESMLRRLIGEHIELRTVLGGSIGHVVVDPGQVEQVVLNLAVNARDAMPQGGTLTIETARVDLDQTYASHHVGVKPGAYVRLTVSDTGVGMDAETRAHIFEPFFTTKARGEGTGLGLATVYGIAKQSGGNVWAYSEPGLGTTFKVYLPRVDEAPMESSAPAPVPEPARGAETVLVVEDEDGVRSIVRRILSARGYIVLDAANGPDALRLSAEHAGPINLLLTDVVLPQMSGRAVADAIAAERPAIKVLFMSGYTDDAIVHHGMLNAGVSLVQKPFTAKALALKVRECLDAPGT